MTPRELVIVGTHMHRRWLCTLALQKKYIIEELNEDWEKYCNCDETTNHAVLRKNIPNFRKIINEIKAKL